MKVDAWVMMQVQRLTSFERSRVVEAGMTEDHSPEEWEQLFEEYTAEPPTIGDPDEDDVEDSLVGHLDEEDDEDTESASDA
jgi:hypothetical protein